MRPTTSVAVTTPASTAAKTWPTTSAWRSAVVAVVLGALAAGASALPTFAEVKAAHRPSDVTLLDRHGVTLQTVRVDDSVRRLAWVPIGDMSPALLTAIVLSEDRRFWEHSGVDWAAAAKSAWANLLNTRTRGASTLTMQLAGLIDDGLARPSGGRSVAQKLGQAVTASRLEASWKKSEILEAYLNSVPFRGEIVGIDALSQTLFAKHASGSMRRRRRSRRRWCVARTPSRRWSSSAPAACSACSISTARASPASPKPRWRDVAACRWASNSRRTSRVSSSTRTAARCSAARSTPRCSAWRRPRCVASSPS